ncbi:unnamed protein product, partial [Iphiclides podalirius]
MLCQEADYTLDDSFWNEESPVGEVERLLREYRQNQELVRNIGAHYYQIIYPVQLRHHEKMGISTREVNTMKGRIYNTDQQQGTRSRARISPRHALVFQVAALLGRTEEAISADRYKLLRELQMGHAWLRACIQIAAPDCASQLRRLISSHVYRSELKCLTVVTCSRTLGASDSIIFSSSLPSRMISRMVSRNAVEAAALAGTSSGALEWSAPNLPTEFIRFAH